MAIVEALSFRTVNRSTVESQAFPVPDTDNTAIVMLKRPDQNDRSWPFKAHPDNAIVSIRLFLSMDVGATWQNMGGCGTNGSHLFNRRGEFQTHTTCTTRLPEGQWRTGQVLVKVRVETKVKLDLKVDLNLTWRRYPIRERGQEPQSVAHVAAADQSATNSTTVTSANIRPTGTDKYLAVGVMHNDVGDQTDSITAATFNTTETLNDLGSLTYGSYGRVHAYELVDPTTATDQVDITSSVTQDELFVAVLALQGVDQTTPSDTVQTASGTSANPEDVVTSATGDFTVDFMGVDTGTAHTADGDQTERTTQSQTFSSLVSGSVAGTASNTHSYTGGSAEWAIVAWNVNQVAAGGASIMNQFQNANLGSDLYSGTLQ